MTDRTRARRGTGADKTPARGEPREPDAIEYEFAGDRPRDEQAAYVDRSDIQDTEDPRRLTDTELYEGELEAGPGSTGANRDDNVETLTELELRTGETDNPDVAAEEGLTWVPPIDPPVVPSEDSREGAAVASGFGVSALDEPYDEDHRSEVIAGEDEAAARIRDALRADSATSEFADHLAIATRGGVVRIRGVVEDVDDTDEIVAVIERVDGVVEVIEELEVRALE